MLRRLLLTCGILSSMLYVGIDFIAAWRYPEYHSFTARAVSELMARGAPTERLVDPLYFVYNFLVIAFGLGVWLAVPSRRGHLTGALLIGYSLIGFLGPTVFEMDVRTDSGPTRADLLHLAMTGVLVLFIFAIVGIGGTTRGRAFRFYSYATIGFMIAMGIGTSFTMASGVYVGLIERALIGSYLVWIALLALLLLRVPVPRVRSGAPPGRLAATTV